MCNFEFGIAAANDDDNDNDDQGLFVKQSMWTALHKYESVGKNTDRNVMKYEGGSNGKNLTLLLLLLLI